MYNYNIPNYGFGQAVQNAMYPYMDKVNQYQQMIQNPSSYINGKVVDNFETITANDVPMDGRFSTFVKPDFSEIEIRQWNANGTIGRKTFRPVEEATQKEPSMVDMFENLFGRIDNLEKSIEKLSKPSASRSKKEE